MTIDESGLRERVVDLYRAAVDVADQRGGDAALRANGLAVTSARALDALVEAIVRFEACDRNPLQSAPDTTETR